MLKSWMRDVTLWPAGEERNYCIGAVQSARGLIAVAMLAAQSSSIIASYVAKRSP